SRTRLSMASIPRTALASFPTRRSSDLCDVAPNHRTGQIVDRQNKTVLRHEARKGAQRHPAMTLRVPARGGMMMTEGIGQKNRDADRKSTRLNSSHVSISYAVFCLKKKN